MRVLVAWRAFGDLDKCRELIPLHEQELIIELERERDTAIEEVHAAYDPLLAPLPDLKAELAQRDAFDPKTWQANPTPDDPYLGSLWLLARKVADESLPKTERKALGVQLRKAISEIRKVNAERLKMLRPRIKDLTRLADEADEKIAAANLHSEREIVLVHETAADLQRICADSLEASRYFAIADRTEIEGNEFNLHLPRYVDTFDPEEKIEIDTALKDLERAEQDAIKAVEQLRQQLRLNGAR
jgi:type I restriction enzyme M protein